MFANAGHNLPTKRTLDAVVELRATGMPLGLLPEMTYDEHEAVLAPGEIILIYSDGLVEAHNQQGEMFGFPRLRGMAGGAELIERLRGALADLAGPGGMNAPGGGPLISTGIMVIYADDESFSFMTPQGHMFAGMITFSAERERETNPDSEAEPTALTTCTQVQALVRASDPLYEIGFRLGLLKEEDIFWKYTLTALADFFGVHGEAPDLKIVLMDPKVQWAQAKNVWHNSAVRTGLYTLAAPVRWIRGRAK